LSLLAAPALATDYCVAPNTTCGGTNVATFEAALDQADDATNADRIFLGAATYTAPTATGYFYNDASAPVEIIGAGIGQSTVTGQTGGNTGVLRVIAADGSSVHDLTVRMPQFVAANTAGLQTSADATRVEVVEAPSQSFARTGVRLIDSTLENSTVKIGKIQNITGVSMTNGGEVVRNVTVDARQAISASFGGTVEHSFLYGGSGGLFLSTGTLTVTDTLMTITEAGGAALVVGAQNGGPSTLNADGLTLIGLGTNQAAVGAGNANGTAETVAANVADTVMRGFANALVANGAGTGSASITTSYSDYDPSANLNTGPGTITQTNQTNSGDARFVDAAAGDYRLRFDSPLIDIGEPVDPTTQTDLAGGARQVDGDLTGGARRDIGAYEYQARPPSAVITGPVAGLTGEQLSFSGTTSSDADAGDTLTFAWTIDGAAAGSASTQGAAFATAGAHSVALTVTDPLGRSATATQTVEVSAPATTSEPPPTPAAADTLAPALSGLSASPSRARPGQRIRFRFQLSEGGAVEVRLERILPGRRVGSACRKPTARNRTRPACRRFLRVTTLKASGVQGANTVNFSGRVRGRRLAAGTYRAVVTATDAAGNRSRSAAVGFRIRAR
jgi:PKD domain